jgi:hypothetical protein
MLVQATDADFLAFYKREAPEIWLGVCNKEGERITGFGAVIWNEWGCACGYVDRKGPLSPFMMHRAALAVMDSLRKAGEPHLSVLCDGSIPGARKWLERLGFRPLEDNSEVWQVKL